MKTYKKFTPEEDRIILEEIRKNPGNLSQSFENASKKIDHTKVSICRRYYRYLLPKNNTFPKKATQFVLISDKKAIYNRKNTSPKWKKNYIDIETKKPLWKRILSSIFQ